MGRVFLTHPGGTKVFCCWNCSTPLTNKRELMSNVSRLDTVVFGSKCGCKIVLCLCCSFSSRLYAEILRHDGPCIFIQQSVSLFAVENWSFL